MRAHEFLTEATLTPGQLFDERHLSWRPEAFLKKLKDQTPFVDSPESNANQYIPAKGEYARIKPIVDAAVQARLENPKAPVPSIVINTEDGKSIPLSKLEKADLQSAKGQVTSKINVQPLGIKIAADKVKKDVLPSDEIKQALEKNQSIRGGNLHEVVSNNKILQQSGELGSAIIQAANDINDGKVPTVKKYDERIQKTMAIDAGEYLGIMQMIHDTAEFPKKTEFLKFLETQSLEDMLVIFPGSQNSQLQDSYGVQNTKTGHSIMISSKGGVGSTAAGAAPALSGLKLPENMIKQRKPGNGIDFILLMQSLSVIEQPFAALNFLHKFYPESVPELYKPVVPFTSEDMAAIKANIKGKGSPLDKKYLRIVQSRRSKAREGGILFYAAAADFVTSFNSNQPIPDFRQTVLSILDMNFVQIFSRVISGNLTAKILWPGKVDGNVSLSTKASASDPSAAGFSFKVTD